MPRVAPKGDVLMIAIDDAWLQEPSGVSHLIRRGMRVRRSHAAVKLAPSVFVSADLDDFEIQQARRTMLESRGIYGRD